MDKKLFQNLLDTLDKEIQAYSKLKEFFEEKKEVLKNSKPDDLGVLDNQILALNNQIMTLNDSRKNIAEQLLDREANMSQFIELAEQTMIMMFNKDEFATKYGITDYDLVNDAFNDILDGNFKF